MRFGSLAVGLWLALRARQAQTNDGFFLAGRTLAWALVGTSWWMWSTRPCNLDAR